MTRPLTEYVLESKNKVEVSFCISINFENVFRCLILFCSKTYLHLTFVATRRRDREARTDLQIIINPASARRQFTFLPRAASNVCFELGGCES